MGPIVCRLVTLCLQNLPSLPNSRLNGKHVVFGRVLEGADVVDKLQNTPVGGASRPNSPVVIADCGLLA